VAAAKKEMRRLTGTTAANHHDPLLIHIDGIYPYTEIRFEMRLDGSCSEIGKVKCMHTGQILIPMNEAAFWQQMRMIM
jgi:hypothetical protein